MKFKVGDSVRYIGCAYKEVSGWIGEIVEAGGYNTIVRGTPYYVSFFDGTTILTCDIYLKPYKPCTKIR